jgi:ABC-type polysaccharide/polyol phosphate export permease
MSSLQLLKSQRKATLLALGTLVMLDFAYVGMFLIVLLTMENPPHMGLLILPFFVVSMLFVPFVLKLGQLNKQIRDLEDEGGGRGRGLRDS